MGRWGLFTCVHSGLFTHVCIMHTPTHGETEQPAWPTVCVQSPYLFDGEVVDEVVVVLVQVAVQGHTVALVEQVLEGVDALHPQRALQAVLKVRIVEDHVEAKHLGPHRNRLP